MYVTVDMKIKEIEREIAMRKSVYRMKVRDGGMSPQEASERITIFEAILEDYKGTREPRFPDSF